MLAPRTVCRRCHRPALHCYCAHLAPIPSRTRVVLLQHPREHRIAIGTARMTHLALPNSELHVGADLDHHPRVQALAAAVDGRTAVLFPGAGALDPLAVPGGPPTTLIVLDGTWIQARKMLARSRLLQRLPRVAFTPARPGNYRIRREPAAHCLATVEAVADVLGRLEGEGARFAPMLRAFDHLVERQLAFKTARPNPYHRKRRRHTPRRDPLSAMLRAARSADVVVLYAEANAHAHDAGIPGASELVQLVATRPATGERFAALIAPRRPLASAAPAHLEIAADRILAGEAVGDALARWEAFARPSDLFAVWGRYTLDLLRAEGVALRPLVDLRDAATRRIGRKPGGPEQAAHQLADGNLPAAWAAGRAGRRLAALVSVLERLLAST